MPIIFRKGFRFANLLGVFGIVAAFCAPLIAGAEPQAAQAEGAPAAKKKIALAQFDVFNTQHVDDINNIYDGLPLALSGRLETSGDFLTVYTGRSVPLEAGDAQRDAIAQIAEQAGAQFLISGMVLNAGIKHEKGIFGTSFGAKNIRHIEVELAVYDGLTGARLLLRRLDEQAQGDVKVGNDTPFGSSIFFETELGQALNRLLDLAVNDIRATLGKAPFSARIVRVDGKKVFLDAGSDSLLKPGDKLVAYAREATPFAGLKSSVPGATERAADMVTLTQIQQQFSIGELTENAAIHGIEAGNIARIDPDEQRALIARQIAAQQTAKAEQEAKAEAARAKAEQAALAEAARAKADQDAKAEAARIKAEKKSKAQAKAKAAAAAKLKAANTTRISAAQKAKARVQAQAKARAAAKAKAARLKTQQEANTEAETGAETSAPQAAESGVVKAKTGAEAATETANVKKKPRIPLNLIQIKP